MQTLYNYTTLTIITIHAQSFIVKLSGERLTTRLRVQLFKAMLHNDVEWYDDEEHTTGSLNAMLYIDTNNVKAVSLIITIIIIIMNLFC